MEADVAKEWFYSLLMFIKTRNLFGQFSVSVWIPDLRNADFTSARLWIPNISCFLLSSIRKHFTSTAFQLIFYSFFKKNPDSDEINHVESEWDWLQDVHWLKKILVIFSTLKQFLLTSTDSTNVKSRGQCCLIPESSLSGSIHFWRNEYRQEHKKKKIRLLSTSPIIASVTKASVYPFYYSNSELCL